MLGAAEELAPDQRSVDAARDAHTDRLETAVQDVRPMAGAGHPAVHHGGRVTLPARHDLAARIVVALSPGPIHERAPVVADMADVEISVPAQLGHVQPNG